MVTAGREAPRISVVVCTRDRCEHLRRVLADLARQEAAAGRYEVVVVDNGSTDGTAQLLAEVCRDPRFRRVDEPEPGLSRARNRGWRAANGEYVAYTDDDCRVPPGWLAAAAAVADEHRPDAFGGPVEAVFEAPPPAWLDGRQLARTHGAVARRLRPGETLWGGNLFLRREVLARLGGFPEHLGMVDRRIGYGEETALQNELYRLRPDAVVHYDPRLVVAHLERAEKQTLRWLLRRSVAKGRDVYLASGAEAPPRRRAIALDVARTVALLAAHAAWRLVVRNRRRFPSYRGYLSTEAARYLRRLGRLGAQWRASR